MTAHNITANLLKELFSYNKETGTVTRTIARGNNIKAGSEAGTKNSQGYLIVNVNGKNVRLHHIAWCLTHGYIPNKIDHINQNKQDNRIVNLREVTTTENNRNMPKPRHNTSGTVGVYYNKANSNWRAFIHLNNKTKSLGSFKTKEEAIKARLEANIKYGFHENHGKERVV